MKITDEQILKIATSHQRQMGSVHPHAIIGTIVDAINEALSQHDVIKNEVAVCPQCKSNEDIRTKPMTHDCMECGYTWQTVL